jgi:hypothetical protein
VTACTLVALRRACAPFDAAASRREEMRSGDWLAED